MKLSIEQTYQLIAKHYKNGQLEETKQLCLQLLKIKPNDIKALRMLGFIYTVQEQYEQGLEVLLKAVQIEPTDYRSHANLGYIYRTVNQFEKSILYYQQALALYPESKEYKKELKATQAEYEVAKINYPMQRKIIEITKDNITPPNSNISHPINIVFFHIDTDKAPYGFTKHTDYKSILYNVAQVAHHFMPNCKVILYTDEYTDFDASRMTYVDEVVRSPVRIEHPMYERMRVRHDYLISDKFDKDTVFIDTDIIFNQDISFIFNSDFDIAMTFRIFPLMSYNEGVIFAKHTDATIQFSQNLLNCFDLLEKQESIRNLYPQGIRAWRGGQLSIAKVIGVNTVDMLGLEYANLQLDDIKLSLLPSSLYNFTPAQDIEYSPEELKQKAIIHFKGAIKQSRGNDDNSVKWYIEQILGIKWI
ncbi:tetratricopeptide repeat protein [Candidatus Albibeggiatoa sp. nov. NOAA]|uniref:tetratricopeptide repeat protein n=1 Tax=Candidatus Albibeggiatoa sp. nov. NOAA TaxID=3162724 RepID=UPI0032FED98F|nr:tetratricopeptide repeat protein [Thiotrichaceae bacterium]